VTGRQWARRLIIWRGAFSSLGIFTFLMPLSALADRITS
jgi:hypothetical protein